MSRSLAAPVNCGSVSPRPARGAHAMDSAKSQAHLTTARRAFEEAHAINRQPHLRPANWEHHMTRDETLKVFIAGLKAIRDSATEPGFRAMKGGRDCDSR